MQKYFPDKIYMLQSSNKAYLGLRKHNKSYVVGFSNKDDARRIMKHVSDAHIMYESNIDTISLGKLYITKSVNPHKCHLEELDMNTFMEMPIKKNIGVILGCEVFKETSVLFGMSSIVVNPSSMTL
jgi:hypothetical protein